MNMLTKEDIGLLIKQQRKRLKMTQEKMADKTGIHEKQISHIETGKNYPTLENFLAILYTLNMKMSDFDPKSPLKDNIIHILDQSNEKELKVYLEIIKTLKENM